MLKMFKIYKKEAEHKQPSWLILVSVQKWIFSHKDNLQKNSGNQFH